VQCVAVCCNMLQCVASTPKETLTVNMHRDGKKRLYSTVYMLQGVAVCCSVLQCVAVCCSVLQRVAVCCSVFQCVAVCCSVLHMWFGASTPRETFTVHMQKTGKRDHILSILLDLYILIFTYIYIFVYGKLFASSKRSIEETKLDAKNGCLL